MLYGNGFIKIAYDEDIQYIVPDPYTVFIDPLATSIEDSRCVIFATPQYIDKIEDDYGKRVPVEGKLNEFKSFVKEEGYASDRVESVESIGPMEDKTDNDYGGGQALVKEAWYFNGDQLM